MQPEALETGLAAPAAAASKPRKVLLRLDDGSLIGRARDLGLEDQGNAVVHLSVDQAAQRGRVTQREITRLQTILGRLKEQYGVPAAPAPAPVPIAQPPKKPRVDPAVLTTQPSGYQNWVAKCQEVLSKVMAHLGPQFKPAFYEPVDPKLLPDYYRIVREPLFMRDIEGRLAHGEYQQPQDFANDLRHHFHNVRLYNPEGDPYRRVGNKAEEFFEQLWAGTGFSQDRMRRVTAGLAAPKFDPEKFEPPAKPKANQGANKRPRDGSARTLSHEVTSGKGALEETGRLSAERIQEIGMFLSREDLPDDYQRHIVSLLPPAMVSGIESGEIELELDQLDDDTLRRIDAWLRSLSSEAQFQGHTQQAGGFTSPQQPSVRVDSYDDDDDDYEEDSDDSD